MEYKLAGHTSKPHMMLAKLRKLADAQSDLDRQKWRNLATRIINCQIPDFALRNDFVN